MRRKKNEFHCLNRMVRSGLLYVDVYYVDVYVDVCMRRNEGTKDILEAL